MSIPIAATLVAVALLVGFLVGAVGIGGLLLVPALTYVGGMAIHVAIASTMVAFLFSGGMGTYAFARRGSIRWIDGAWLGAGAMPGAYLGATAMSASPGYLLELLIAGLIVASAVSTLLGGSGRGRRPRTIARGTLLAVGIVTGFASSMSGTGGPLVLIPILLWMHVPVLAAIGLSQVIQLPIAAFATAGNLVHGSIDMRVAATLSVLLMIGVWLGAHIAHRVPGAGLKRFVSLVLLAVGLMMVVRVAMRTVGAPGA